MKMILVIFGTMAVACAVAAPAIAADDQATVQQQLSEQRMLLQTQPQKLDDQAKALERLDQRLIEVPESHVAEKRVSPIHRDEPGRSSHFSCSYSRLWIRAGWNAGRDGAGEVAHRRCEHPSGEGWFFLYGKEEPA